MFEKAIQAPAETQATPTRVKQLLTYSRANCFRTCPRKEYLSYGLGIKPIKDDLPRRWGSCYHLMHECNDRADFARADEALAAIEANDPYEATSLRVMFQLHERYQGTNEDGIVAMSPEIEFRLDLINPDTGHASTYWDLGGKMDRLVQLRDGRLALMEYKTTTQDFGPGAPYWQRLHLDQQLSLYVNAARALGYPVETILYDVTRRPMLRPLAVPVVEDGAKVVIDGDGNRVRTKDGKKWRETADAALGYVAVTRPETVEEFADRIVADVESRPGYYFARIEIARLDSDLEECKAELWQQAAAMREAQRTGRHYRNPSACYSNFGSCDYLPICLLRDLETHTPTGYTRETNVHPELANGN